MSDKIQKLVAELKGLSLAETMEVMDQVFKRSLDQEYQILYETNWYWAIPHPDDERKYFCTKADKQVENEVGESILLFWDK